MKKIDYSKLEEWLKDKRLSVRALAEIVDVPVSTMHGWIKGSKGFPIEILMAIKNRFQLTSDEVLYLFANGEKPKSDPQPVIQINLNDALVALKNVLEGATRESGRH